MCETDNLRISSVSRLLSHSGLIGPRGAYTHTLVVHAKSIYPHPPVHPPTLPYFILMLLQYGCISDC